jgi:hypothetical protein
MNFIPVTLMKNNKPCYIIKEQIAAIHVCTKDTSHGTIILTGGNEIDTKENLDELIKLMKAKDNFFVV